MKEISDALSAFIDDALTGLHVSAVGRVESYDATKQRASVQPMVKRGYQQEDGSRATELLPIINEVPVMFLGSGPYSITWPIAKGDLVLLIFTDHSLDRLLVRGEVLDPVDDRSHTMSDAIAIPGFRPFSAPVSGAPSGAGGAMVIQAPGQIHAGGSDALATKADIDALRAWAATHTHSGGGGGTPSTPPPAAAGTVKLKGS